MENRINVAELLKDCPRDMELDCLMYDNLYFDSLNADYYGTISCYTLNDGVKTPIIFSKYGTFNNHTGAKCVIFPKGKTTWEGFQRPFKDGDIVALDTEIGVQLFIFKEYTDAEKDYVHCYVMLDDDGTVDLECGDFYVERLATEEEKQNLFDAIKANGFKWNAETKTLEKLIEHKFNEGDWVTDGVSKCQIYFIDDTHYWYSENCILGSIESVDKQYHIWTINDAKDGDVLVCDINKAEIGGNVEKLPNIVSTIFTFKKVRTSRDYIHNYCHLYDRRFLGLQSTMYYNSFMYNISPATKEQCNLLFQKIKEAGYKWNSEIKALEELIEPKFKVGDKIREKGDEAAAFTISDIDDSCYYCGEYVICNICDQSAYHVTNAICGRGGNSTRGMRQTCGGWRGE